MLRNESGVEVKKIYEVFVVELERFAESRATPEICGMSNSNLIPPGKRFESLSLSIRANSGKWFRQARQLSNAALRTIIPILAPAKVR